MDFQEPWYVAPVVDWELEDDNDPQEREIHGQQHAPILIVSESFLGDNDDIDEYAGRVVACVNACKGLARPELIPSMIDNLRMLMTWAMQRSSTSDDANMLAHVATMLAKLEGAK